MLKNNNTITSFYFKILTKMSEQLYLNNILKNTPLKSFQNQVKKNSQIMFGGILLVIYMGLICFFAVQHCIYFGTESTLCMENVSNVSDLPEHKQVLHRYFIVGDSLRYCRDIDRGFLTPQLAAEFEQYSREFFSLNQRTLDFSDRLRSEQLVNSAYRYSSLWIEQINQETEISESKIAIRDSLTRIKNQTQQFRLIMPGM